MDFLIIADENLIWGWMSDGRLAVNELNLANLNGTFFVLCFKCSQTDYQLNIGGMNYSFVLVVIVQGFEELNSTKVHLLLEVGKQNTAGSDFFTKGSN